MCFLLLLQNPCLFILAYIKLRRGGVIFVWKSRPRSCMNLLQSESNHSVLDSNRHSESIASAVTSSFAWPAIPHCSSVTDAPPTSSQSSSPPKVYDDFNKFSPDIPLPVVTPVTDISPSSCPYFRWLYPNAKSKRLLYFNSIIPIIYLKTFPYIADDKAFQELLKHELRQRWDDLTKMEAMKKRLDVAQRYVRS